MDLIEANKYALQVTAHQCSAPPGQYDATCDGGGCNTKAYQKHQRLCPNSTCLINTQMEFRQSVSFNVTTIHVELRQGDNKVDYDVCSNQTYVESMKAALEYGMTLVGSYWGDSYSEMEWLDRVSGCTGNCSGNGKAKFSDITISDITSNA